MISLNDYKERREAIDAAPDASTREDLIVKYVPLVHYVVNTLTFSLPPMLDADDLVGYGMMGLINAVDRFDASQGVKFETYAMMRIRGYIIDQLRALDWMPRSARQRVRQVERTREDMEARLGRVPTSDEVAQELGLDRKKYEQALQDAECVTLSLDAMLQVDDEQTPAALFHVVRDEASVDPGQAVETHDLKDAISQAIGALNEREQYLLRLYYFEERTLQEISRELDVSESRACQIHTRALKRLRLAMVA